MPGSVRIIAGEWRGRKPPVPDVPGLRPSGDRARETLFNWLAPWLPGAVCADLYAGSGALGFEAASRGAQRVMLVERDPVAARSLESVRQALGAMRVEVLQKDALAWLEQAAPEYDLLFADPPFEAGVEARLVEAVDHSGCLKPGGFMYLEAPADRPPVEQPERWTLHREKRIGEVVMRLYRAGLG